jgi:hypothetical protein
MAGITALAASASLPAGSTSADKVSSGWVAGERVVLATSPTGTNYTWTIAAPSGSNSARSALSASSGASVTFTPDVGGTYAIRCLVDATEYFLRLTVQGATIAEPVEALRLSPRTDASVPAPAAGLTLYYSSNQSALVVKDSADDVFEVDLTAVP